jgi:ribosomal protein L11 methylase PrmA
MTRSPDPVPPVLEPVAASHRDRAGRVHRLGDRILRWVAPDHAAELDAFLASDLQRILRERGQLIATTPIDAPAGAAASGRWFEHPRVATITYPWEWPFGLLREAALLHLEVQRTALAHGWTLRDASAYNVQFVAGRPLFIDVLSFRRYRPGELWLGQRQFTEQFLAPLLLTARLGVAHHAWYRGQPAGITAVELADLLGWRGWTDVGTALHLMLPARLQRRSVALTTAELAAAGRRELAPERFAALLRDLHEWIAELVPAWRGASTWADYRETHGYSSEEAARKAAAVERFVAACTPRRLLDVGGNDGGQSAAALGAGAREAIVIDADPGALDRAAAHRRRDQIALLPLFVDLADPSPAQGWRGREHEPFAARIAADALLALAVVHHLAIGRNLPLAEVIAELVALAPLGLVEFVPKSDPTVQRMLSLREDVFPDYDEAAFAAALATQAEVVGRERITDAGRVLYTWRRRG